MTLGEKIASARKEKGMTQEMLAEQLGVTRQAVARRETGKALPGTANLFMLRQLLGIPLEAADMEATDLEGTTGTLANTEKAESLTAKAESGCCLRQRQFCCGLLCNLLDLARQWGFCCSC